MSESGTPAAMRPLDDNAALQRAVAALPVWAYEAGATVLAEGTRTGRLLILKQHRQPFSPVQMIAFVVVVSYVAQ